MTDKTMSVPLFPGASTPEGQARINKAIDALNDNAARCREILNDVVENLKENDSFDSIDYDVRFRISQALNQWHECSDELLDAVSGRNNNK
jgi:hypothetical protein